MSIAKLEHQVAMPTGGSDGSRRLRLVHGRQEVNLPAAERAAEHLCISMGGVLARGSRTITSCPRCTARERSLAAGVLHAGARSRPVHGVLRENAASRQEFCMLARDD